MPLFFWITLAAGYFIGLVGAAWYLPQSLLMPVLGHLVAVSLAGAVTIGVILSRRRAERKPHSDDGRRRPVRVGGRLARLREDVTRSASNLLGRLSMNRGHSKTADLDMRSWTTDSVRRAPAQDPTPERRSPLSALSDASWVGLEPAGPAIHRRTTEYYRPSATREASAEKRSVNHPSSRVSDPHTDVAARYSAPRSAHSKRRPAIATATREAKPGTLRCVASPLVVVPQRHFSGLMVQGRLQTSAKRSTGRSTLVKLAVPREQLSRFDKAVLGRALSMIERHGADLVHRDVFVEGSIKALHDENILHRLEELAEDPMSRDTRLVLMLRAEEVKKIPSRIDGLPRNLALGAWVDDPSELAAHWMVERGIEELSIDARSLCGRTDVPLEADPVVHRMRELEAERIAVTTRAVDSETTLLDILDYPVDQATGRIFGRRGALMADGSCTFFTFDEAADADMRPTEPTHAGRATAAA